MIVIRYSRVGRKNKPQFRLVVQEQSSAPTGKHIEILGSWDPNQKKGVFKNERIQYWLSQGAQASDSVHNLLVAQKIIEGKKRVVKMPTPEAVAPEAGSEEKKEGIVVADQKTEEKKVEAPAEKEVEAKKAEIPAKKEDPKA